MADTVCVTRKVQIPIQILTADDCDERWKSLPQYSALTTRCIEFKIPAKSPAGCVLMIPVKNGEVKAEVKWTMPEFLSEGDTINMRQREDGSWKMVKKATSFSFCLPSCCQPGDEVKSIAPDGTALMMNVPEGVNPGDMIALKRHSEGGWAFDKVEYLPAVDDVTDNESWSSGPYPDILELLKDRAYLQNLPVDDNGILHINVPFCGRFQEHRVFGNFAADHLLTLPGVNGVRIYAMEINERYYDWAIAQCWLEKYHPKITLVACVADLAEDPLPDAGFSLGIHPEVTKGGYWFGIIGSILRSSSKGLCVFSTFYEVEMKTLVNMIDMFKDDDTSVKVIENPYYEANERPRHPAMRYIIVVRRTPSDPK